GVAGRNHAVGLALLHRLERQPHARAATAAHGLAGLVLHLHGNVGVHDGGPRAELRVGRELGLDAWARAEKHKAQLRLALERQGRTRHYDARTAIPTHRIERYRARPCHDPLSTLIDVAPVPGQQGLSKYINSRPPNRPTIAGCRRETIHFRRLDRVG